MPNVVSSKYPQLKPEKRAGYIKMNRTGLKALKDKPV